MVKIFVGLLSRHNAKLIEAAGASAVVFGVSHWSTAAAWVVGGVAALLKSAELDLRRGGAK